MSSTDAPESPQSALLSDDALAALGLREQPFADAAGDDEALFADEVITEQLADVRQALITGDDLLLILGEEGSGRSTLLAQLAAESGLRIQCFSVRGSPRFSTRNLFVGMLEAFKVRPPEKLKEVLDELVPCLQTMTGTNTLCVVVLDDAQAIADLELTTLLSGMLYLNGRDESLLRIALAAPPAFEERIPDLLPEGADLPYSSLSLEPYDETRAARYLAFRLERAGRTDGSPFDADEIAALVARSGGRPGALNVAAAEALEAGWGVPGSASLQGALETPDAAGTDAAAVPPELLEDTRRGGAARALKLALGALAALMILGGLLLFQTAPEETSERRYRVVEQREAGSEAERLRLLRENEREARADGDSAAPADAAGSGNDAASDAVPRPADGIGEDGTGQDGTRLASDASEDASENGTAASAAAPSAGEDATRLARAVATSDTAPDDDAPASERRSTAAGLADDAAPASAEGASPSATAASAEEDARTVDPSTPESDAATATVDVPASGTPEAGEPSAEAPSAEDGGTATETEASRPTTASAEAPSEGAEDDAPVTASGGEDAPADPSAAGSDEEDAASTAPEAESTPSDAATEDGPGDGAADEDDGEGVDEGDTDVALLEQRDARPSPVSDPEPVGGVLESPNWVLVQDAGQYTVQMIASSERESVEAFLVENALPPPNSIFTFDRRGRTWYALVHGLYPSIDAAREAIERMPPEAQTNQPWIRAIGRIQNALRERN